MNAPRVLIADGDDVYRRHLRDFLKRKNEFSVVDAGTGEAAVNIAESDPPSVILLGVMFPDMSGIEVCRKLKKDERLRSIPVIFHTARLGLSDKLSAFVVGAYKYLTKPCEPDDIYECLNGVLRIYHPRTAPDSDRFQQEEAFAARRSH